MLEAVISPRLTGGDTCVIETSTNLMNWLPVDTNTTPGTVFDYAEAVLPSRPARFYRAVWRP